MSMQTLREFINRHSAGATGLAALGAALDARASGTPLDPVLAEKIDALLAALGGQGVLDGLSAAEAAPVLAELRLFRAFDNKLLSGEQRKLGWAHTEPEILVGVGEFARMHAHELTHRVIPLLDGLAARMSAPGGAFLDIGVGIAGTATEMAKLWPNLRVVGIDVWQPSLALARGTVERSGFGDRIELRELAAEQLSDEAAFDFVWMPIVFMPERILPAACERTLRALRPGGWVILTPGNYGGASPAAAAVTRLRLSTFGGPLYSPPECEALLQRSGYVDVHTLPADPRSPIVPVVGRRQPA